MRTSISLLGVVALGLVAFSQLASAQGDPKAGEKVFVRCKVCHTGEKGVNRVGPSLFGVVGRQSGTVAGFPYSDAMKKANITWNAESLNKYLADPKAMVPGNKMAFPGVKDPKEREDVIAYLETLH